MASAKVMAQAIITTIIDAAGDGAGNTLDRPVGIVVDDAGNVYVAGRFSDNAFRITLVILDTSESSGGSD